MRMMARKAASRRLLLLLRGKVGMIMVILVLQLMICEAENYAMNVLL